MAKRLCRQPRDPWSRSQCNSHIGDHSITKYAVVLGIYAMRITAIILLSAIRIVSAAESKRGLNLGSSDYEQIDLPKYLVSPLLTWVYNYDPVPTKGESYGNLTYVPMLWGQTESSQFRTTFLSGPRYPYVLSFNEPDMTKDVGGSNLPVETALSIWQAQLQPLANDGYKIGLPSGISFAG